MKRVKVEIIDFELGKIVINPKTNPKEVEKVLQKRIKKINQKKSVKNV